MDYPEEGDVNRIESPSLVPEKSWNEEVVKHYKALPITKMPGTNYQDHPYHKNR